MTCAAGISSATTAPALLFGIPSDAEGVIGPRTLLDLGFSVSTFGEGPDGELYVADLGGGTIYRIVAGD